MGDCGTARMSGTSFFIIFSDLDGTLLDHKTYAWKEAQPALNLCKGLRIPVVLVSSKTRAEMDSLRRKMSISSPFISENGGGIFFPDEFVEKPPLETSFDKGLWKWALGLPYMHLTKCLHEIREELEWNIKGFSDMSIEEISQLTGLDRETSRLAAMREFDEPFIISEKKCLDKKALLKAAGKRGLTVTCGGRFYHLQGKNDKGKAMEKIISWYSHGHGKIFSIALGDSPNDFSMLERANFPVLIRSQQQFPDLKEKIPRLKITREMGPKGWNTAVLDILGKKEEKSNA